MKSEYTVLKSACYTANASMSIVAILSPLLFLTFREFYNISYSLLGLLVMINFFTQLIVDLIFSFFSHKFNIEKTVKIMPVLTVLGLVLYAVLPVVIPSCPYMGIVIGTVVFSSASGLAEVLISPVIAAIPSENPQGEMSKLHSVFAWGVVSVILFSTLYLHFANDKYWMFLPILLSVVPLISAILFSKAEIPHISTPKKVSGAFSFLKNPKILVCIFAIFLGGASECIMEQWSSSYLEKSMGIPKIYGDIFGVALFSVMLGLGRTLYAKRGKHIHRVLISGALGASICYCLAALSPIPILGLFGCAFTGLCTSMLWPGNLIVASERFPQCGVFIYAAMAAGGDLGASIGPQIVGLITDFTISSPHLQDFALSLDITPEQLGMKLGLLFGMIFPVLAVFVHLHLKKGKKH